MNRLDPVWLRRVGLDEVATLEWLICIQRGEVAGCCGAGDVGVSHGVQGDAQGDFGHTASQESGVNEISARGIQLGDKGRLLLIGVLRIVRGLVRVLHGKIGRGGSSHDVRITARVQCQALG